ncbi:TPA: hypothetical protein ACJJY1_004430, partial [Enterobacter cloacae]
KQCQICLYFTIDNSVFLDKKGISQKATQNLLRKKMHTPHHLIETTIILLPRDLHANVPHIGYA